MRCQRVEVEAGCEVVVVSGGRRHARRKTRLMISGGRREKGELVVSLCLGVDGAAAAVVMTLSPSASLCLMEGVILADEVGVVVSWKVKVGRKEARKIESRELGQRVQRAELAGRERGDALALRAARSLKAILSCPSSSSCSNAIILLTHALGGGHGTQRRRRAAAAGTKWFHDCLIADEVSGAAEETVGLRSPPYTASPLHLLTHPLPQSPARPTSSRS